MPRGNIGGPVGPFDKGQSIFDFLDDVVLNRLAKALSSYMGLTARPPLQIQSVSGGDIISLGQRIDNFVLVQLIEDLDAGGSALSHVMQRDGNDVLRADTAKPLKVFDPCFCKRYSGQRGIAFLNFRSKNATWEFWPCPEACDPGVSSGFCFDESGYEVLSSKASDCTFCNAGTSPQLITVTVTGITNTKTCWDCEDLNATYVLERIGIGGDETSDERDGSCRYRLCLDCAFCGIDVIEAEIFEGSPGFLDLNVYFKNEQVTLVTYNFQTSPGDCIVNLGGNNPSLVTNNSDCNMPSTIAITAE